MQTLGWIIWGFGCLLLLKSLAGLRKEKGRLRRLFFCICTGAGLTLTCFTSFSKFHLLWILPLQFILGLLIFGLLAATALSYHKITRRKPEKTTTDADEFPPFGTLKWSDYDWWEGKVRLPAWAGFQSRGGPYGSQDSAAPSDGSVAVTVNPDSAAKQLTPTDAQCQGMQFQIERGGEVVQSVLTALLPYHRELKRDWEMDDEDMPPASSHEDFRSMIGLSQVHVLPHVADGLAYVGLEFGCDWDDEHGLGIVVHGARVVEIGQADTSFDWRPDEQQKS